jgi:hypothetical protein
MAKEKQTICKTKGCNNPVLDGKYCEHCKQERKEDGNKVKAVLGGAAILGGGTVVKKVGVKKIVEVAGKVLQVVLRR